MYPDLRTGTFGILLLGTLAPDPMPVLLLEFVFITFGLIPGTIGYQPRNPLFWLLLPPDDVVV